MTGKVSSLASCTALELFNRSQDQPETNVQDELGFVLPAGTLVEIYGAAGSGKTQYALSLGARLAEKSQRVLYLFTGVATFARRLGQLCPPKALDSFLLRQVPTLDALRKVLDSPLPPGIRLIVIDSLPPLLIPADWSMLANPSPEVYKSRSRTLFELAARLKTVAADLRCAVLVVNQVVDHQVAVPAVQTGVSEHERTLSVQDPALGLAWSSCINIRLQIVKTTRLLKQDSVLSEKYPQAIIRFVKVIFAPHMPTSIQYFLVENSGIARVPPSDLL